jgi:hypothetical protein
MFRSIAAICWLTACPLFVAPSTRADSISPDRITEKSSSVPSINPPFLPAGIIHAPSNHQVRDPATPPLTSHDAKAHKQPSQGGTSSDSRSFDHSDTTSNGVVESLKRAGLADRSQSSHVTPSRSTDRIDATSSGVLSNGLSTTMQISLGATGESESSESTDFGNGRLNFMDEEDFWQDDVSSETIAGIVLVLLIVTGCIGWRLQAGTNP